MRKRWLERWLGEGDFIGDIAILTRCNSADGIEHLSISTEESTAHTSSSFPFLTLP